jgi:hypothetical protein
VLAARQKSKPVFCSGFFYVRALTLKRAKLFLLGSRAMTPRRAPILAMIPPLVQYALTFLAGLGLDWLMPWRQHG